MYRKIEFIKPGFCTNGPPYEVRTLGFTNGKNDFILGEFYFGSGMDERHEEIYNQTSSMIDDIVLNHQIINEMKIDNSINDELSNIG